MADTPPLAGEDMDVVVAWHWDAGDVREWPLRLPGGASVRVALDALAAQTGRPTSDIDPSMLGIWGRPVTLGQVLKPGDRIEVYRALLVDPKLARRERFKRQGSRGTGLFAKRRPGAKAGY